MVNVEFDSLKVQQIEKAISKLDRMAAKKNIEEYLEKIGSKIAEENIKKEMPLSRSKYARTHAKIEDSLRKRMIPWGFELHTRKKYNYLIFPNYGIGFRNKTAQKFFEKGMEQSIDKISKGIMDKIVEVFEKEIN